MGLVQSLPSNGDCRGTGIGRRQLATNSEHGIYHGIETCDHRETRSTTGFFRLVYNRVGVAGADHKEGYVKWIRLPDLG